MLMALAIIAMGENAAAGQERESRLGSFAEDASGQADSHRPAWDWQYVIRKPVLDQNYSYRARLVICPFHQP
jgi:hypothetical protein